MNILITGGASGLGEKITRKLSCEQSNKIFFTYNSSVEKARTIEKENSNTKSIQCNFEDIHSLNSLIDQMKDFDLDGLIHNASTGMTKNHFHKMEADVFEKKFQNNIMPVIKITQEAITQFRKKEFGKIITILSSACLNSPPIGWSEYVANKAYLASLSKSWAKENAHFNITANCISPSFMKTHFTCDTDERVIESMIGNHPLKKLLTPDEVAESVSFLIKSSQQINGINLIMNSAADVI